MDAWGFLSDGFIVSREVEIVTELHTLKDIEVSMEDHIIDIKINTIIIEVE